MPQDLWASSERSLQEAKTVLVSSVELPGLFAYFGEFHSGDSFMYLGDPRAWEALDRARSKVQEAAGHEVLAAEAQCGQGHLLLSLGQEEDGYDVLEAGTTRLGVLGSLRGPAVNSRAAWLKLPCGGEI